MNKPRDGENAMEALNVRVPVWIKRRIETLAKAERRTLSDMTRLILERAIATDEQNGD